MDAFQVLFDEGNTSGVSSTASTAFTTAVNLSGVEQREGEGGRGASTLPHSTFDVENDVGARCDNVRQLPKKRAYALAAFLSCLSCIVLIVNAVVNFAGELVRNEEVMRRLSESVYNSNVTSRCNKDA